MSGDRSAELGHTAVSLFAGVDGIGLALSRSGVRVTAAVEIDAAARGVINDRCPETTLFTDVTEVTADELRATGFVPERGILTAGWPCQGNSVAGGRKGLADPRSGLWSHVVRLLDELHPAWFLGENVPGLLSVTGGEDFGRVLQDVADLGYGFAYRVLDAQFFGVPQRRRRVFIVGRLGDARGPVEVLLEPEGCGGNPPASRKAGQGVAATLTRGSSGAGVSAPGRRQEDDVNLVVAPTLTRQYAEQSGQDYASGVAVMGQVAHTLTSEGADASEDGSGRGTPVVAIDMRNAARASGTGAGTQGDGWSVGGPSYTLSATARALPGVGVDTTVRRLTPRECERLQGFPDDWTATSWGKPQADSARYRQMGNAVAVPCVEWIARRIVRASYPRPAAGLTICPGETT